MFIKPATRKVDGQDVTLVVRDPDTKRPLAAEGEVMPDTAYWLRRKRDGDVVEIEAPAKKGGNGREK